MKRTSETDKLIIKNGWVFCPICNKGKLLLIRPDTTVRNLSRKCKLCGQETIVNIEAPEPESETDQRLSH